MKKIAKKNTLNTIKQYSYSCTLIFCDANRERGVHFPPSTGLIATHKTSVPPIIDFMYTTHLSKTCAFFTSMLTATLSI